MLSFNHEHKAVSRMTCSHCHQSHERCYVCGKKFKEGCKITCEVSTNGFVEFWMYVLFGRIDESIHLCYNCDKKSRKIWRNIRCSTESDY